VHWPFPNYHAPGCDGDARNPDSKPWSAERFLATWSQMERIQKAGLARYIGMSNMTVKKLDEVLPHCAVKPALIEMEHHPAFQQPALFDYCKKAGIAVIGFCPLGSPNRPERDKTVGDIVDTALPAVREAAAAHGIHPALVCVKWAVQRGAIPIPFSTTAKNYQANLKCVTSDPLTDVEMEKIARADCDCRLVKGQVFLWPGARSWEDLWE
jgi:alcohol dehydrogenase (NADP+)